MFKFVENNYTVTKRRITLAIVIFPKKGVNFNIIKYFLSEDY